MSDRIVAQMPDPKPPTHGPAQMFSPVIASTLNIERPIETFRYNPPFPPSRFVVEYLDGEIIGERDATEEEYATARASYERADADYKRTGGVLRRPGPVRVTAIVECADGSKATAELAGEEWRWLTYTTPPHLDPGP